jgi:bacteriocin-like protein
MKLNLNSSKYVKGTSDKEDVKKIAGKELTDDELDNVSGGVEIKCEPNYLPEWWRCTNPTCLNVYEVTKPSDRPTKCENCKTMLNYGFDVFNYDPRYGSADCRDMFLRHEP